MRPRQIRVRETIDSADADNSSETRDRKIPKFASPFIARFIFSLFSLGSRVYIETEARSSLSNERMARFSLLIFDIRTIRWLFLLDSSAKIAGPASDDTGLLEF